MFAVNGQCDPAVHKTMISHFTYWSVSICPVGNCQQVQGWGLRGLLRLHFACLWIGGSCTGSWASGSWMLTYQKREARFLVWAGSSNSTGSWASGSTMLIHLMKVRFFTGTGSSHNVLVKVCGSKGSNPRHPAWILVEFSWQLIKCGGQHLETKP